LLPHFRTYGRMLEIDASFSDSRTDAYDAETLEATVGVSQDISGLFQRNVGPISTSTGLGVSKTTGRDLFGPLDTTLVFARLSGGIDRRDDTLDATRGFLLGLEIQPAYAFGQSDGAFARLLAEVRAYQALGPLVLGARLRIGSLIGSSARAVPPEYRFYAGGGGSVRGYAYQSLSPSIAELSEVIGAQSADDRRFEYFGGDSLFDGTLEARWRPEGRRIGYVAFLDGGAASLERIPDVSQLRYAVGIGVRYYTDFGPLRVDLAVPLDPRADDDPVQLYISIGQAF
jgi:translocation and assembly module TamA